MSAVSELRAGGFPIRTEPLSASAFDADLYSADEDVLVSPDGIVAARVAAGAVPPDLARLVGAI